MMACPDISVGWAPRRRTQGFTLIEVIISISVAAIVLLVINATFFSALRLHDATHARIDEDLAQRRALGLIRRDLEGLVLPPSATSTTTTLAGQFQTNVAGTTSLDGTNAERVSPDLTTSCGRIDGWNAFSDLQRVAYFVTPEPNGENTKSLVRVVTRNLLPVDSEPQDESQTLLTGLTDATMTYFDGTDWTDSWDSTETSTLPTAIKFSITLAPRGTTTSGANPMPIELIVPVLVATRTTAQQTAAAAATTTQ